MKIYVDASARCDGNGSELGLLKELMKRQRLRLQEMKS